LQLRREIKYQNFLFFISFHKERACEYLNENAATTDTVDEVLHDFRSQEEDVFKAMLKVCLSLFFIFHLEGKYA
jgi:hypothetical protein